jgi:DivIVA domain-containing protein
MPHTPDEVANKKFQVVIGRGYDRTEVDEFLDSVAEDYSAAIQKIAIAASGGITTEDEIASEIGELLRAARQTADRIKEKAQAQAEQIKTEAERDARGQIGEAEKRRAEIVGEAESDAEQLINNAEERAREVTESSVRHKNEAVARLQERYASLVEHEKELRERTDALERLVTEMQGLLEPIERIDLTGEDAPSLDEHQTGEGAVAPIFSKGSGNQRG